MRGLGDLQLIMERMAESGRALASVNVAAERNIPVTFVAKTDAAGGGAGSEKPSADTVRPDGAATPSVPTQQQGVADLNDQEKHLRSILRGG